MKMDAAKASAQAPAPAPTTATATAPVHAKTRRKRRSPNRVLVFDTETTGVPSSREMSPPFNLPAWPHIAQLAFVVFDGGVRQSFCRLVRLPPDMLMPEDARQIHGLTTDECQREGVSLVNRALPALMDAWESCDLVVGHNVAFDVDMVTAALLRLLHQPQHQHYNRASSNARARWKRWLLAVRTTPTFCTMRAGKGVCRLPSQYTTADFKLPKLVELHAHLFPSTATATATTKEKTNSEPQWHDAGADVLACLRCYWYMEHGQDPGPLLATFQW